MSISNSVRRRLQHDLEEIEKVRSSTGEFQHISLTSVDDPPNIYWKMQLFGAKETYWQGQKYDFEIHFGRNFPFEPPRLHFPSTPLNAGGMKHPAIGRNGNLELDCVSKDNWNCSWTALQLIREVNNLFTKDPEFPPEGCVSALLQLSEEPLLDIVAFLPLREILNLSQTCKKALVLMHSNSLWARLYYARCQVPPSILYGTGTALQRAGPGPVRECTGNGRAFQWRYCREAYIRAHQCFTAIRSEHIPRAEVCAASELALLLPLAFPADLAAGNGTAANSATTGAPASLSGPMTHLMAMAGIPPVHHAPGTLPASLRQEEDQLNLALRYRCLRSARLAQWLGGSECIRGNILRNYWGNIPVTTLIFLSSIMPGMGRPFDMVSGNLAARIEAEARVQAEAAHHRVTQLEDETSSLQREMGGLLHAKAFWTDAAPQDMDFVGANTEIGSDDVDNRKTGGQPIEAEDAPAPAPGTGTGADEADLHKVQWVEHMLVDNAARCALPLENCGNFDRPHWRQASAGVDALYGPDLYDLVEILHELNTAFSARFREFPLNATLDCQDANGDWVPGVACSKAKSALTTAPAVLFSQSSKPTDTQLESRAQYLLAQIALRDQRRLLHCAEQYPSSALRGAVLVEPTAEQVNAALHRLTNTALKATSLKPTSDRHRASPRLCVVCGTVTCTRSNTCSVCKNYNCSRMRVSFQEPEAQVFLDTLMAHSVPPEETAGESDQPMVIAEPDTQQVSSSSSMEVSQAAPAPNQEVPGAAATPNYEEFEEDFDIALLQSNHNNWGEHPQYPGHTANFPPTSDVYMSSGDDASSEDFARAAAAFYRRQDGDLARRRHQPSEQDVPSQQVGQRRWGQRCVRAAQSSSTELRPATSDATEKKTGFTGGGNKRRILPPSAARAPSSAQQTGSSADAIAVIKHYLQGNASPYLSFSARTLSTYFRQLCGVLAEEAKGEATLAAAYRNSARTLAAETSSGAEHPPLAGGLEEALWARLPPRSVYREDILNNLVIHYGRSATHDNEDAVRSLMSNRVYDPFHLSRSLHPHSQLTVHFLGFDARFDETISTFSARLAPYRTHTSRPMTMQLAALRDLLVRAMDETNGVAVVRQAHSVSNLVQPFDFPGVGATGDVLGSAQSRRLQSQRATAAQSVVHPASSPASSAGDEAAPVPMADTKMPASASTAAVERGSESVDILVRCLWLMSKPGGGVVRYKVPAAVKVQELVQDYCAVLNVPAGQVRAVRLDMFECIRYAHQRRAVPGALRAEGEDEQSEEFPLAGQEGQPGVHSIGLGMTAGELSISNCYIVDLLFAPSRDDRFLL